MWSKTGAAWGPRTSGDIKAPRMTASQTSAQRRGCFKMRVARALTNPAARFTAEECSVSNANGQLRATLHWTTRRVRTTVKADSIGELPWERGCDVRTVAVREVNRMSTERLRILIVEDETLVGIALQDQLARLGHAAIAQAKSAAEALEQFRKLQPDLVLVDVG